MKPDGKFNILFSSPSNNTTNTLSILWMQEKKKKNTRNNNNPTWATRGLPLVGGAGLCMALLTFIILVSTGIANVSQL